MFIFYSTPASSAAVKEWRIPTILFLTGPFAGQGVVAKWMAEQAAGEINASGGIAGKPLVLDMYDSGMDPKKATSAMAKAIDSKALVTVGPWLELEARAAMPLAMREGILEVGQGGEDAATQSLPWTVWLNFRRDDLKHVMRMWVKAVPGMKSSVSLGIGAFQDIVLLAEVKQKELEAQGIKSKGFIDVPWDSVDFSTPVVKALATGADTFLIMSIPQATAKIVNELVSRGADRNKIFIGDGACDSAFIELSKGHNEGIYCQASLTYPFKPKWAELNKKYAESHGGALLPVRWYEFYDAFYLIKAAIENRGITGDPSKLKQERIAIRDFIANYKKFDGCKYDYDIIDNFARVPMYLFQMRSNKFEYVDMWKP